MPDSKITIRLPDELAAKLAATADRYEVTRTAILLDLLATGLDDWEPAQRRTAPSDVERLENAIEVLRLELAEAIERIDRVERRTVAQSRPTVSAQPRPAKLDKPGRSLGQIAFDLELTQNENDRNYDKKSKSLYGVKFRDHLLNQGWTQQGRQWFEPVEKT